MVGENNKNINPVAELNIPLSLFSYKDYNSDFIISWYNVASKIYKQINYSSAEKQRLNLALSVLMFPYIALTALGIVSYKQATKKNGKDSILKEKKTNQAKKLAYNILTLAVVCINVVILTALLIPSTVALIIFYALNKELSKDLITVLKISKENRYENQNITLSIHDKEIETSNIKFDVKIEFPKQFHRLIRDLTKDNNWVKITSDDKKDNITLKLSAGITLKDGLIPLRSEIKKFLDTSLEEFTATIGKLIALEKKDITYDKLKELLNEFRLKVVDSIDPRIIGSLIEDAYKVAFIQAIKVGKERREKGFILGNKLEEVLVRQELKNQGEKLPTEKEIIIKELNKLKGKEINANNVSDEIYKILKLEYELAIKEGKIAKKTNTDIYKEYFPQKINDIIPKVEEKIKELNDRGKGRYTKIESKLKKMHEALKKENVQDDNLKQELKDLFKPNTNENTLHQNFRRSQLDKAVSLLKHIPWDEVSVLVEYINNEKNARNLDSINKENGENLNLVNNHRKLHELIVDYNERVTDEEINNLINKIVEVIAKHKLQSLYEQQKENGLELFLKKIIEPELFKNASLKLLKGAIEKQYENLKNEHDSVKTNYDLVKELIDESLKILSYKFDSLPQAFKEKNLHAKAEESMKKLKAIKHKIHDDIKKAEAEKIIELVKTNTNELTQLNDREECKTNMDDQSVSMMLLDRNNIYCSINKLIDRYEIVDDKVNIQNRLKKQIIEIHLKNSEKFLQLLKQLKLEQEELTINEKTENAYKARLFSNEKIKFSIIEDKLIELLKKENFDKIKTEIKTLLEAVELEYCLADRCIKNPTVAIKDNIKHFCQDLLSPLIDELTTNFINNLQKDKGDGLGSRIIKSCRAATNWVWLGANIDSYKNINNATNLANKTIGEVDEIIQYFETTYEEMGGLIGNTFSDEGETFRNTVWPRIKDNLYEIWGRFLQDIEIEIIPLTGKTLLNPKVKANITQKTH